MTAPQAIGNSDRDVATISQVTDYSITRILHMTREEWRAQLFHDIATTFEDAFDRLEATR